MCLKYGRFSAWRAYKPRAYRKTNVYLTFAFYIFIYKSINLSITFQDTFSKDCWTSLQTKVKQLPRNDRQTPFAPIDNYMII